MNKPLVSIIIPVFNAETTLVNTLNSVFNQSYSNIQVIVIDGLSTDNSMEIIKQFPKIDYFISEKDCGVYDAMNKGIDKAIGDYLFFLGADDFLRNNDILNQAFNKLNNESLAKLPLLIFGNVENIDSGSDKIPEFHRSEFSSKLIWKNTLHHQGTFYHKSVFKEFRYDSKLRVLADYELNLQLLKRKASYENLDLIISVCRADGLSKVFSKNLYREELLIKKRNFSRMKYLFQIPWVWMKFLYKNVF